MARSNFNEETWYVVAVNDKPYLYCDMRIDRNTIPEGLIMYEAADADSDGRFCRGSNGILVDFLGTLVGKDLLPMEDGIYYCRYDTEFDRLHDQFEKELSQQLDEGIITEKEFEKKMIDFDENHFPDDKDGFFVDYDVDVEKYLSKYSRYLEEIIVSDSEKAEEEK